MKIIFENIKAIMGLVTVLLVFAYLFGITFSEVKLPKDVVPQVLIAIVAFGKDIYNYFFGSSQGMSKATDQIAQNSSNPIVENSQNTTIKEVTR